jgi:hypothetical protein
MSSTPKNLNNNGTISARDADSSSKLLLPIDAPTNACAMRGATPGADAKVEAGTSALESTQLATKEQDAAVSPPIDNKKRALENAKVPRRSNRIINNTKKQTDQEQQQQKKAKHGEKMRVERVLGGQQARDAENHRRMLQEIRDELGKLAADDKENDTARDAATCVIHAINMMLQQDPIDNSLGRILQQACGSNNESLLDELDEDLGERLGVAVGVVARERVRSAKRARVCRLVAAVRADRVSRHRFRQHV